ncbi:uncharacterized protein LOC123299356 [Chrysoperla carnea]|uniref:uncharacterized protein LOC123299356 n=1 Tax=Chrysoperla carnea TaxID=189513 RepID=UPI001D0794DD|nr:uncharacterized protein LOC123299356 [Chrysoperla carnea]
MFYLNLLCLLIISFGIINSSPVPRDDQCRVSINNKEEFTEPQVLILQTNLNQKHPFKYPTTKQGDIYFKKGEKVLLSCPGPDKIKKFTVPGWQNRTEQIVSCIGNNQFEAESKKYDFSTFACAKYPYHNAKITGKKCAGDKTDVIIGFRVQNKQIPHISVCHDDLNMATLYTFFNLTPAIKGYQRSFPRPSFTEAQFYNRTTIKLDTLYAKKTQQETVGRLLGDPELGKFYIKTSGDFYLARGHLTAKADFIFGAQQRSTFYYINTAPQWQIFNAGNWNDLEYSTRKFSGDRNVELEVYSGTYDTCQLPDKNGKSTSIYLLLDDNNRPAIPVPKYFWKVLYNPITKEGTAFIGVNNPYFFDNTTDVFCTDVCDQISWVSWNRKNVTLGYGFCCDVNEFRKTVKYLPEFNVNKLLV